MRKFSFIVFITLLLLPVFAFADCSNKGYTIIYVNGIFTDKNIARLDKDSLKEKFKKITKNDTVNFINGYNSSHLGGIGDLLKSTIQAYKGGALDYDLENILTQIHGELATRKVLLVGHSQGTFYTNAAYDYLINNGVPKDSISVYNVATPADEVAGDGNYVTSSNDKVINSIVKEITALGFARKPLSANIDIPLLPEEANDPFAGHSLSGVYLQGAPERVIGDIQKGLENLADSNDGAPSEGCFDKPKTTLIHQSKDVVFKVADKSIATAQAAYNFGQSAKEKVYLAISNFGENIAAKVVKILDNYNLFEASISLAGKPSGNQNLPSVDLTSTQNTQNIQDNNSGTQIIQNENLDELLDNSNETQEEIDDILERIDILQAQLIKQNSVSLPNTGNNAYTDKNSPVNEDNEAKEAEQSSVSLPTQNVVTAAYVASSASSAANVIYPKILISEVQIEGLDDAKQEFVELYNPNSQEVSLTDWYLQRKTKTGSSYATFASNTLFSGKKIRANSYFLIAREGSSFASQADIIIDNPLTEDNSLILKNPGGEIADKVGWGQAQEYELLPFQNPIPGKSIGRQLILLVEQDTDNNSIDFLINSPTPKANNTAYVAPLIITDNTTTIEAKDEKAPQAVFTVDEIQKNIAFTIHFEITDPVGTVTPSGIYSYIFRWKLEGGSWQEEPSTHVNNNPSVFSGARDFIGDDEKSYYFQVKAKDLAGNESDWQSETPVAVKISISKKILINEIQTAGVTTKDEFIELYNPNGVDINLAGFSLKKKTSGGAESNLVSVSAFLGTIKAFGYFLVAPEADDNGTENYTGLAAPDIYYSGKTFSIAANNTVLLYDNAGALLDKVGFGTAKDFETIAAPNPETGKSIERKKLGADTDNNQNDFKISDEITPKGTFPKSVIEDATDYANNPSSNVPGAPAYSFLIKWKSAAANIDFFQVQYKLGETDWKDWLPSTPKTEEYFQGNYSLFNDNVYYFRVAATDTDGNKGPWAEIKIDVTNPVVINEVGYAGTNADEKDQWIELYNKSDKDIDLTNWKIVSGSLNINLKGTILSKGYFILEASDDDALSDVLADQIFIEPLGKNRLYLRDKNNRYVDEFYTPPTGLEVSSFIKDSNHYSIERVSAYSFGMHEKNWKINNGNIMNGKDRDEGQVYGTPGSKNSVNQLYTYYASSFIQDTVLKKEIIIK